jgi:hypothetical protein
LPRERFLDAKALLAAGRPAASIATGLYALEIRLKVLVCKNLDVSALPTAIRFHDLGELLVLAGRSRKINDPSLVSVKYRWDKIREKSERLNEFRYLPDSNVSNSEAVTFLDRLEDPTDGVLTWLSTL